MNLMILFCQQNNGKPRQNLTKYTIDRKIVKLTNVTAFIATLQLLPMHIFLFAFEDILKNVF